jgi:hypothetical protein
MDHRPPTGQDEVAERLRRWTANPMGSARVSSNLILVVSITFLTRVGRVGHASCFAASSAYHVGSHGVMVSTQDSESCDPSSNLGGTLTYVGVRSDTAVRVCAARCGRVREPP